MPVQLGSHLFKTLLCATTTSMSTVMDVATPRGLLNLTNRLTPEPAEMMRTSHLGMIIAACTCMVALRVLSLHLICKVRAKLLTRPHFGHALHHA